MERGTARAPHGTRCWLMASNFSSEPPGSGGPGWSDEADEVLELTSDAKSLRWSPQLHGLTDSRAIRVRDERVSLSRVRTERRCASSFTNNEAASNPGRFSQNFGTMLPVAHSRLSGDGNAID